jgi:hypothetical protein
MMDKIPQWVNEAQLISGVREKKLGDCGYINAAQFLGEQKQTQPVISSLSVSCPQFSSVFALHNHTI